ncbi:hypothetical protein PVAG01_07249 [Phlyctema vagabunda]|uniref:SUZ-C domain-containing protein n=1 Tax=Phlyctema vagabunda TaxID=108571 RepID=A0ABR4PBW9_9HELO
MSKTSPAVPDAWDDDWESQADHADQLVEQQQQEQLKVEQQVKITKAERLAKHADENKKIWESAETPETPFFLAARDTVPLKTEFKPALKVLSRKPAPKVVMRQDPLTGLSRSVVVDDDDEEEDRKDQPTPAELRLRAQQELQLKKERYEEARARIMGSGSGTSSPGTVTPPGNNEDGKSGRGKGRGRGGVRPENPRPISQSGPKELFDPSYSAKPGGGVFLQKRGNNSGRSAPRDEEQVIRAPKGPDGNGRGGFGYTRGGKMV